MRSLPRQRWYSARVSGRRAGLRSRPGERGAVRKKAFWVLGLLALALLMTALTIPQTTRPISAAGPTTATFFLLTTTGSIVAATIGVAATTTRLRAAAASSRNRSAIRRRPASVLSASMRNRLPREIKMFPSQTPFQPTVHDLHNNGRAFPPNHLHQSWLDYLYWDTELDP